MSKKIKWGVLSTAGIGRKRVIPAIQQSNNGIVHAVASRNLDSARLFADKLDIPVAYGSYEELLTDPDIDAIYNPLPNSMHAEWSIKAAEAGKPMLCEKPLASNTDEAQKMVDAFAGRDILFAEAFMYRFHPQTVRVKQLLDEGTIGTLQGIMAAFTFPVQDESNIRLNVDLAGGSLMDVGCYCVNVIRLMTGAEPVSVQAFANMHNGVDESLTGILKFESGVLAHFDSSLRSSYNHMYQLRGTKGRILVEEAFVPQPDTTTTIRIWDETGVHTAISIAPANHYTLMAEDFADALLNNRPPRYAPQDAVEQMRVLDSLYAAL
ncbi:MAG: Gfo/Idh/MocA family protein [Aggregatilineales bacterium]